MFTCALRIAGLKLVFGTGAPALQRFVSFNFSELGALQEQHRVHHVDHAVLGDDVCGTDG